MMELGKAVWVDGEGKEPFTVAKIHDNGTVTVHDMNQAAMTVDKDKVEMV
jgi:hypothetical protein